MDFSVILPPERREAMRRAGLWPDRLLTDCLDEAVARHPDRVALLDFNSATGRATSLSYRQLQRLSTRIAMGLSELGIASGDVVSFQLPNWWQVCALMLAGVRIGAVLNPLMPIFRQRELRFMLGLTESKLLVVPREFRGVDYPAMTAGLRAELPALRRVLVVGGGDGGGDGAGAGAAAGDDFEATLLQPRREDAVDPAALFGARRPAPDDVMLVMFTSGTTGEPKGVMHTANTLLANLVPIVRRLGLTPDDAVLMASPVAHLTGLLYGLMMPLLLGGKTVLQDVWNPERAARSIQDEALTWTMAATPFLADFAQSPEVERYDVRSLRMFVTAGAPIPRVLVQSAMEKYPGLRVVSGWGMTENGLVTTTLPDDAPERVFGTDGSAYPGMELRVVDGAGLPQPAGTVGRLQARGCSNFVGYLKRPQAYGTDAEGWFETGDNAHLDGEGYLRIAGRSKDLIIRGGENVPVVEVEELLYRHPAVREAALVAMPDERLGERGCAFVTLRDGEALELAALRRYLEACQLARDYWPERLEIVSELPRTPSGKIQKFKLRERAQSLRAE